MEEPTNDYRPPTTNELDSKAKARLITQARKLSRVLGDVPTLQDARYPAKYSQIGSASLRDQEGQLLRRSPSQPDIVAQNGAKVTYKTGVRRRRPVTSDGADTAKISGAHSRVLRPKARDEYRKEGARYQTYLEEYAKPTRTEESKRASLAKLSRHLGETIPSHLVFPSMDDPWNAKHSPIRIRDNRRKSMDSSVFVPTSRISNPLLDRGTKVRSLSFVLPTPAPIPSSHEDSVLLDRMYVSNSSHDARLPITAQKLVRIFGEEPPWELFVPPPVSRQSDDPTSLVKRDEVLKQPEESSNTQDREVAELNTEIGVASEASRDTDRLRAGVAVAKVPIAEEQESTEITTFQQRRRRAAKLTRFFGVGYQDILSSYPASKCKEPKLDVKVNARRFWKFADNGSELQHTELQVAINRLRELKAR